MTTPTDKKVVTHIYHNMTHYEFVSNRPREVIVKYRPLVSENGEAAILEWDGNASTFSAFQEKMINDRKKQWVICDVKIFLPDPLDIEHSEWVSFKNKQEPIDNPEGFIGTEDSRQADLFRNTAPGFTKQIVYTRNFLFSEIDIHVVDPNYSNATNAEKNMSRTWKHGQPVPDFDYRGY